MVKHAQTIRRLLPTNLSVFDHFVCLALKLLKRRETFFYNHIDHKLNAE